MRRHRFIVQIFWLIILPFWADGQVKDPCHYSTEGTDFWFGILQNRTRGPEHYMEIKVSSRNGADFTVTYGPQETVIGNYTVSPNTSVTVPLDTLLMEPSGS
jgi:hypothetical protein